MLSWYIIFLFTFLHCSILVAGSKCNELTFRGCYEAIDAKFRSYSADMLAFLSRNEDQWNETCRSLYRTVECSTRTNCWREDARLLVLNDFLIYSCHEGKHEIETFKKCVHDDSKFLKQLDYCLNVDGTTRMNECARFIQEDTCVSATFKQFHCLEKGSYISEIFRHLYEQHVDLYNRTCKRNLKSGNHDDLALSVTCTFAALDKCFDMSKFSDKFLLTFLKNTETINEACRIFESESTRNCFQQLNCYDNRSANVFNFQRRYDAFKYFCDWHHQNASELTQCLNVKDNTILEQIYQCRDRFPRDNDLKSPEDYCNFFKKLRNCFEDLFDTETSCGQLNQLFVSFYERLAKPYLRLLTPSCAY